MKIKLLGIDLAKNVFQVCALNQANKVLFNRSVRRAQFRSTIAKLEPTTIAVEACSSAHYWGRTFEAMGHQVLLIPAQHVTPFVRGGKNGDRYLRTLMIHGARSVISLGLKNRPELAQWVQPIIDRRGFNKAVVALANKLARISWVIVTTGEPFDMKQAFKPAA